MNDLELTKRTIELAARGIGLVSPNPLVGCVVVSADNEVVGEGTYVYDNVIHAEAIALAQAGDKALGGTAYVSLEPHDHHGKTPPCTEALINAGIKRVVCPIEDPNPLVSGRGFARLRDAGIEVVTGILADEASRLNEKFICWHKNQRPFVHLKLAMSLDGRISVDSSVSTANSGDAGRKRARRRRCWRCSPPRWPGSATNTTQFSSAATRPLSITQASPTAAENRDDDRSFALYLITDYRRRSTACLQRPLARRRQWFSPIATMRRRKKLCEIRESKSLISKWADATFPEFLRN